MYVSSISPLPKTKPKFPFRYIVLLSQRDFSCQITKCRSRFRFNDLFFLLSNVCFCTLSKFIEGVNSYLQCHIIRRLSFSAGRQRLIDTTEFFFTRILQRPYQNCGIFKFHILKYGFCKKSLLYECNSD